MYELKRNDAKTNMIPFVFQVHFDQIKMNAYININNYLFSCPHKTSVEKN